jgi:hypothetical protein
MAKTFGVTSSGGYGILQTVTQGSTAEKAQARGTTGKVEDAKAYSVTHTATAEFVADTVTNPDDFSAAGTSLTIGDVTGLITSVEVTESNTDYVQGTVSIEVADGATQVAYS